MAKKPINGFSCASCEAFIGDLKDKDEPLPWQKFPLRDEMKLYRGGNNFSKMLQMVNIEGVYNNIQVGSSKGMARNASHTHFDKKELMIPKIRANFSNSLEKEDNKTDRVSSANNAGSKDPKMLRTK